eukprot:Opistho-2@25530
MDAAAAATLADDFAWLDQLQADSDRLMEDLDLMLSASAASLAAPPVAQATLDFPPTATASASFASASPISPAEATSAPVKAPSPAAPKSAVDASLDALVNELDSASVSFDDIFLPAAAEEPAAQTPSTAPAPKSAVDASLDALVNELDSASVSFDDIFLPAAAEEPAAQTPSTAPAPATAFDTDSLFADLELMLSAAGIEFAPSSSSKPVDVSHVPPVVTPVSVPTKTMTTPNTTSVDPFAPNTASVDPFAPNTASVDPFASKPHPSWSHESHAGASLHKTPSLPRERAEDALSAVRKGSVMGDGVPVPPRRTDSLTGTEQPFRPAPASAPSPSLSHKHHTRDHATDPAPATDASIANPSVFANPSSIPIASAPPTPDPSGEGRMRLNTLEAVLAQTQLLVDSLDMFDSSFDANAILSTPSVAEAPRNTPKAAAAAIIVLGTRADDIVAAIESTEADIFDSSYDALSMNALGGSRAPAGDGPTPPHPPLTTGTVCTTGTPAWRPKSASGGNSTPTPALPPPSDQNAASTLNVASVTGSQGAPLAPAAFAADSDDSVELSAEEFYESVADSLASIDSLESATSREGSESEVVAAVTNNATDGDVRASRVEGAVEREVPRIDAMTPEEKVCFCLIKSLVQFVFRGIVGAMHAYARICVHMGTCTCVRVYGNVCMYVYGYVCVCVCCVRMYVCKYMRASMCLDVRLVDVSMVLYRCRNAFVCVHNLRPQSHAFCPQPLILTAYCCTHTHNFHSFPSTCPVLASLCRPP